MESQCSFPPLPDHEAPDWQYSMRRSMQEVVPNVFLGPYSAASKSKFDYLRQYGITHIICVRHPVEANLIKPNFPNHFHYLVLDIVDSVTEPIMKHFSLVKQFINGCLFQGGKVLLHGNAGVSRSSALMIAYIMESYGLSFQEAYLFVQSKRYCINPNEGFVRQLREFQPIYLAYYQQGGSQTRANVSKRPHESDDDIHEFGSSKR